MLKSHVFSTIILYIFHSTVGGILWFFFFFSVYEDIISRLWIGRALDTVATPMLSFPVAILAYLRQKTFSSLSNILTYPVFFIEFKHTSLWNFKFYSDYERKLFSFFIFFLCTLPLPVLWYVIIHGGKKVCKRWLC